MTLCICVQGPIAAKAAFGYWAVALTANPSEVACQHVPWSLKKDDFLRTAWGPQGWRPGYALVVDRGMRPSRRRVQLVTDVTDSSTGSRGRLVLVVRGAEGGCMLEVLEEVLKPPPAAGSGAWSIFGNLFGAAELQETSGFRLHREAVQLWMPSYVLKFRRCLWMDHLMDGHF